MSASNYATPTCRIFLSYARGDDEPFVRRLYEDLKARCFDVWLRLPIRWMRIPAPVCNGAKCAAKVRHRRVNITPE